MIKRVLCLTGCILLFISLSRGVKVTVSQSNTEGTTESAPGGGGGNVGGDGPRIQGHPGVGGSDGRRSGSHGPWGGYDSCTQWIRRVTGIYMYAEGYRVPVHIRDSFLVKFCAQRSCYSSPYYGETWWRGQGRQDGSHHQQGRVYSQPQQGRVYSQPQQGRVYSQPRHGGSHSQHGGFGGIHDVRPWQPAWYSRRQCYPHLHTTHRQGYFDRRYRYAMESAYGRHVITCDGWDWRQGGSWRYDRHGDYPRHGDRHEDRRDDRRGQDRQHGDDRRHEDQRRHQGDAGRHVYGRQWGGRYGYCYIPLEIDHNHDCSCQYYRRG